jgi:hypothetical protein
MKFRNIFAGITATLFAMSAQANTLGVVDSQQFHSLRIKLHTVTGDVTQAADQANEMKDYSTFRCLDFVHNQASSVESTAAAVGDLIALSILMKDNDDEILVLRALRTWLIELNEELTGRRKFINAAMSQCSNSATVNVKGQAVLNVLSEFNGPAAALSRTVGQVVPTKR